MPCSNYNLHSMELGIIIGANLRTPLAFLYRQIPSPGVFTPLDGVRYCTLPPHVKVPPPMTESLSPSNIVECMLPPFLLVGFCPGNNSSPKLSTTTSAPSVTVNLLRLLNAVAIIWSFSSPCPSCGALGIGAATFFGISRYMVPPTLLKVPPVSVIPDAFDSMSDLITRAAEVLAGGGAEEACVTAEVGAETAFAASYLCFLNSFTSSVRTTVVVVVVLVAVLVLMFDGEGKYRPWRLNTTPGGRIRTHCRAR